MIRRTTRRAPGLAARVLSALLLLALLAAALPTAAFAAPSEATCRKTHTVDEGETLRKIAKMYDLKQADLAEANDLDVDEDLEEGQKLCIPAEEKAATSKGKLDIKVVGDRVSITGSEFPKQESYIVKVGEGRFRAPYKIGQIKAKKDGTLKGSFNLPDTLEDATIIQVCLKNSHTDALTCRQALHQ